jgi:phosphoglycolate phosphatase
MISKVQIKDYQNIIWDWNGTLLDDVWLCADIMNNLLRNRSLPTLSIGRYLEIFTFPVKEYYLKAGHDLSQESFEKISIDFIGEYEDRKTTCVLFPYAKEVLERIRSLNIKQYLLSAYKQDDLKSIINYYRIRNYFTSIRGLDHIHADGKIEIGIKLMNEISGNDSNTKTLLIGDTIHDYEVAEEIGADCLLISNGHQDEKRLRKINVPILKNLEAFYSLFNNDVK